MPFGIAGGPFTTEDEAVKWKQRLIDQYDVFRYEVTRDNHFFFDVAQLPEEEYTDAMDFYRSIGYGNNSIDEDMVEWLKKNENL